MHRDKQQDYFLRLKIILIKLIHFIKLNLNLAGIVEIHETYDAGNDMMGMREVKQIVIPAKTTFELKPGAHHVMLMKLKQDIKKGYVGDVTLIF
ncbi:MAG: copper chaperone PCu(A)C [Ignavibacteriales bacterium]|nr:copper chaperone PCu(A)C [Ignavibacteriales bacterium]